MLSMSGAQTTADEVLMASRSLREWSVGLRHWSRSARQASCLRRQRAQEVNIGGLPQRQAGAVAVQALPPLGMVRGSELVSFLVRGHGFGHVEAEAAVAVGMLVAGYPGDYGLVSAADAFDVVEHAVRHRS